MTYLPGTVGYSIGGFSSVHQHPLPAKRMRMLSASKHEGARSYITTTVTTSHANGMGVPLAYTKPGMKKQVGNVGANHIKRPAITDSNNKH